MYMARGKHAQESNKAIAMVVAIVLVASTLLVLRPSPEQVVAFSQDGLVRVEGVTRSPGSILIERIDGVDISTEGVVSPIYEVTLDGQGVLEEAELLFSYESFALEGLSIQEVAMYRFDRASLSWKPLPTFFDLSEQTLTSTVTLSGSTLVGLGERVQDE